MLNIFYPQGVGGWSESERISCQTLILKKLLKKLYLQGMWGWSESEGISYKTTALIITNRKWKNAIGPKVFWTQNFLHPKIFRTEKLCNQNCFWPETFPTYKF